MNIYKYKIERWIASKLPHNIVYWCGERIIQNAIKKSKCQCHKFNLISVDDAVINLWGLHR